MMFSLPVLHSCPGFCSTPVDRDHGKSIVTGVRTAYYRKHNKYSINAERLTQWMNPKSAGKKE